MMNGVLTREAIPSLQKRYTNILWMPLGHLILSNGYGNHALRDSVKTEDILLANDSRHSEFKRPYEKGKNYVKNDRCVLCDDGALEEVKHLFFECDFSIKFWWRLSQEHGKNSAL
jgi:hypothetical protein